MSERHTHQAAASINHQIGRQLQRAAGDGQCWVPTLALYSAVQVAEGRFADGNIHTREHGDRYAQLHLLGGPAASAPYQKLKTLSSHWRYDGRRPTDGELEQGWRWVADLAAALQERWPPAE